MNECKLCNGNFDFHRVQIEEVLGEITISFIHSVNKINPDNQFKFCPMCGRELAKEDSLLSEDFKRGINMEKYLLFAYDSYYPDGGMNDCILVANSIEELNSYVLKYIEENDRDFDYIHYYDCQTGKTYEAEFEDEIYDHVFRKKKFAGWNLHDEDVDC